MPTAASLTSYTSFHGCRSPSLQDYQSELPLDVISDVVSTARFEHIVPSNPKQSAYSKILQKQIEG